VLSSPGHPYCQPQGKALDTAYSVFKVLLCFQLHHHTKRAFEIFQALAKLSPPLSSPEELKKQKTGLTTEIGDERCREIDLRNFYLKCGT
jgi:hypothetical protein